jgi:hypothetical protein
MCEQVSFLTSIKSKDINCPISADNSVCAYLKLIPELSICAAKNKHRFHIREVNFIICFSLKNKTVLDDIFVHFALFYLMVFSNLIIQHCQ